MFDVVKLSQISINRRLCLNIELYYRENDFISRCFGAAIRCFFNFGFFIIMKRFSFTTLAIILISSFSFSQENIWTIQECIDYALKNNLDLKRSDLSVDISKSQLDQSKMGAYPSLNSNMSHSYNFGRSIDPFTNQFENQSVQSNSFNLTSSVNLFNAYKTRNTIASNSNDLAVNKENKNTLINTISLQVADAYLQILFSKEQLNIALKQETLSSDQLEITKKLFKAGKIDKTELSNIEAQLSNNKFQVLSAQNNIQIAELRMVQLLQLPYGTKMNIEIPNIDVEKAEINMSLSAIIDQVLGTFPEMKSAELKVQGAIINEKIAKADLYPQLRLMANLNSVYSQSRKEKTNPVQSIVPIGLVEGTNQNVVSTFTSYDFVTTPFNTQLSDNFGQSLGFNLSIPIFNGHRVKNNIRISQLTKTREEINRENTKNQLINDVTLAHTQYLSSRKEFFAAQKNYETQKQTYELNKKKSDAGLISSTQLIVFRSQMDIAEINMNRIKFQYIFSKLRIYFYQKNTIQLD